MLVWASSPKLQGLAIIRCSAPSHAVGDAVVAVAIADVGAVLVVAIGAHCFRSCDYVSLA
eukprot:5196490-Alexandrium_andersonii.AAC.3